MTDRAETVGRAMHEVETQPGVAGRIPWERLLPQHRDAYWQMYLAARAADDDLIRRQDAALTAVRELAENCEPSNWEEDDYAAGRGHALAEVLELFALASPDTTQEAK